MAFAVLDLGGSATTLGQVLAARTVPMVLVLLFGGVLADRFPRSLVLQASNLTSALAQGATAVLLLTGHAELWIVLLVLQTAAGVGVGSGVPGDGRAWCPRWCPATSCSRPTPCSRASRGADRHRRAQPGHPARRHRRVRVGRAGRRRHLAGRRRPAAPGAPSRAPAAPRRPADGAPRPRRSPSCARAGGSSAAPPGSGSSSRGSACSTRSPPGPGSPSARPWPSETIGRQAWGWVLSAEAAGALVATLVLLRVALPRPLLVGMLGGSLLGIPMVILGVDPQGRAAGRGRVVRRRHRARGLRHGLEPRDAGEHRRGPALPRLLVRRPGLVRRDAGRPARSTAPSATGSATPRSSR